MDDLDPESLDGLCRLLCILQLVPCSCFNWAGIMFWQVDYRQWNVEYALIENGLLLPL